jgi:hypothetical protein
MSGAFNWFGLKKKKENFNYIEATIEDIYEYHHFMKKVFGGIFFDLTGTDLKDVHTTMKRFSNDYKFMLRIPEDVYIPKGGNDFSASFEYIDEMLKYSPNIKGFVLKLGSHGLDRRTLLKHIENVIFGRLLVKLERLGVNLYLENDITLNTDTTAVTTSNLINIRQKNGKVKLLLNHYNSRVSGQTFILASEKNKGLRGIGKAIDALFLQGIDYELNPIEPTASGDEFKFEQYRDFLVQFKNKPIVYKGDIELIIDFINKLNESTN